MAALRLPMRQLRAILRLKCPSGRSHREIAKERHEGYGRLIIAHMAPSDSHGGAARTEQECPATPLR